MRTTLRGTLSELRVKARLVELECRLLDPVGHDFPFDVVAYHCGRFSRVQVKTAREGRWRGAPNGFIAIPGGGRTVLTAEDCDVILAWHEERGVVYAIPPGAGRLYLRTAPALNGQALHVRPAADYELRAVRQLWPDPLDRTLGSVSLAQARTALAKDTTG